MQRKALFVFVVMVSALAVFGCSGLQGTVSGANGISHMPETSSFDLQSLWAMRTPQQVRYIDEWSDRMIAVNDPNVFWLLGQVFGDRAYSGEAYWQKPLTEQRDAVFRVFTQAVNDTDRETVDVIIELYRKLASATDRYLQSSGIDSPELIFTMYDLQEMPTKLICDSFRLHLDGSDVESAKRIWSTFGGLVQPIKVQVEQADGTWQQENHSQRGYLEKRSLYDMVADNRQEQALKVAQELGYKVEFLEDLAETATRDALRLAYADDRPDLLILAMDISESWNLNIPELERSARIRAVIDLLLRGPAGFQRIQGFATEPEIHEALGVMYDQAGIGRREVCESIRGFLSVKSSKSI